MGYLEVTNLVYNKLVSYIAIIGCGVLFMQNVFIISVCSKMFRAFKDSIFEDKNENLINDDNKGANDLARNYDSGPALSKFDKKQSKSNSKKPANL